MLIQAHALEGEADSPPTEKPRGQRNIDVSPPLPCPQSNLPVGARLGHFANCWGKITDNQWVLSVLERGYRIPFETKSPLSPTPILFQQSNSQALEEAKLLEIKGSGANKSGRAGHFYLGSSSSQKRWETSTHHRSVNFFARVQGFKTETVAKVRRTMQPNDWLSPWTWPMPTCMFPSTGHRGNTSGSVFGIKSFNSKLSAWPQVGSLLLSWWLP